MVKKFCLLSAVLLTLLCFASCGSGGVPTAKGDLAAVVGMYQGGRCAVTIERKSGNTVSVYAMWGESALNATEWKLTGTYDLQTNCLTYSDCTCKHVTYDEHGSVAEEKVEYENGTGTMRFAEDGSFTWQSEPDAAQFDAVTFVKLEQAQ